MVTGPVSLFAKTRAAGRWQDRRRTWKGAHHDGRQQRAGVATGKLCYIEIPAADVAASAEFYQRAFGWKIRRRGAGAVAFDDTAGEVTWFRDPGNVLGVYEQPGLAEAEAPGRPRGAAWLSRAARCPGTGLRSRRGWSSGMRGRRSSSTGTHSGPSCAGRAVRRAGRRW